MSEKMGIPRIRHDFKRILVDDPARKAIKLLGFDGKEYWIPRSLCTLIKERADRVVLTLAVSKFEEITGVEAEPLTTTFVSLGGRIMGSHVVPACEVIESEAYPLLPMQRPLVNEAVKSRYSAFFCDAGTGKTIMTLTVAYSRLRAGIISRVVVLCPASLMEQWVELSAKYYPDLSIDVISIHSASYEQSLARIRREYEAIQGVKQLIVDESHLCRNQSARRSRNVDRWFAADYCMIATAYPVERNAGDLFYQLSILDRAIIGDESYGQMQSKFMLLGGQDGETVVAYQNTAELARRISPYILRLRLEEVYPEIKPIQYHDVYFDMSDNQLRAYGAIEALAAQYDWMPANKRYQLSTLCHKLSSGYSPSDAELEAIFGNLGKLGDGARNVSRIAGIGYDAENPRMEAFLKVIHGIEGQAIIWCNYIDEMEAVHAALPGSAVINGSNRAGRYELIREFQNGNIRYLIISIAINEGFNLQNACNVLFYSDSYSRTKAENAMKRVHRIGQTGQVHVWRFIGRKSIDERIRRVRIRKDKICKVFDNEDYND